MESHIRRVPLGLIRPNPYQPPTRLEVPAEVVRLKAESIDLNGLIQMPVARAIGEPGNIEAYEIADGWQRYKAIEYLFKEQHIAEWFEIPLVVRELTDQQMADYVIAANTVRQDLSPIDKAHFFARYLDKFGITQSELAARHGCSQGEVANTIRLLDLPDDVQRLIISRDITETHGRILLQLKEKSLMSEYARLVLVNQYSAAELSTLVKEYLDSIRPKMMEPETPEVKEALETAEAKGWKPETETASQAQTATPPAPAEVDGTVGQTPEVESDIKTLSDGRTFPYKPGETANEKAGLPKVDGNTKAVKPAAVAPPASPPPVKTNWGRKLVIEEREHYVQVSCMKSGGIPIFKQIQGTMLGSMGEVAEWLRSLEVEWEKEGK